MLLMVIGKQIIKLLKCGILIQLSNSEWWAASHQRCPETRALQNEVHSPTSTRAECVQSTPSRIRPVMHAHKCWLSWHLGLKDCRAPCSAWKCASQLVEDKLGLDWVASRERCLTSSHWAKKEARPSGTKIPSPTLLSFIAVPQRGEQFPQPLPHPLVGTTKQGQQWPRWHWVENETLHIQNQCVYKCANSSYIITLTRPHRHARTRTQKATQGPKSYSGSLSARMGTLNTLHSFPSSKPRSDQVRNWKRSEERKFK